MTMQLLLWVNITDDTWTDTAKFYSQFPLGYSELIIFSKRITVFYLAELSMILGLRKTDGWPRTKNCPLLKKIGMESSCPSSGNTLSQLVKKVQC